MTGEIQLDHDIPTGFGHHPSLPVRGTRLPEDPPQILRQVQTESEHSAPFPAQEEEVSGLDYFYLSHIRSQRELRPWIIQIHPGEQFRRIDYQLIQPNWLTLKYF